MKRIPWQYKTGFVFLVLTLALNYANYAVGPAPGYQTAPLLSQAPLTKVEFAHVNR